MQSENKLIFWSLIFAFLASCGGAQGNGTPSFEIADMNSSNISGRYNFAGGDCNLGGEAMVLQRDDSVEFKNGENTSQGGWSLAQGGETIINYNIGAETECIGVFKSPTLFTTCHSSDQLCTTNWEKVEIYNGSPVKNINTTEAVTPNIAGDLMLVGSNCPSTGVTLKDLTIVQDSAETKIQIGPDYSFSTSIISHGGSSASGSVKYNEGTTCYGVSENNKIAVLCINGNQSCGLQYTYK